MSNTIQSQSILRHPDRFFIGGNWVVPSSNAQFNIVNPATEAVFYHVAEAQKADMLQAVSAAREAFDNGSWPTYSHQERAKYLRQIAKKFNERQNDVSDFWPKEMGILHAHAQAGASAVGSIYEYYADLANTFSFEEYHQPTVGAYGLLNYEAVGVVGVIIPWNAPVLLAAYKIAPALLAGCTIILKASPEAPSSAYILAEIAEEVGLPAGVINVVTADREVSEQLVRHPGVDKISFTGSSAAGKRIGSICGERIARCTLELGGKSAAVVLDDYDIEAAAEAIVSPACMMTGQMCSSLTRIVVMRERHDQLVEALSARFAKIVVGDPFHKETQMGPIALQRQFDRILRIIAQGRQDGATLAVGGGRSTHLERGFFIQPTIFGNVDNHSELAREEIFGPVLSVIPADNQAHAINIANDTPYGLNNSVFTNDPDRAYEVARKLRSGTVGHNMFRSDFGIAFGGFKQSGIGREGGVEGLRAYLEPKTIILEGTPTWASK